jgi:hypothetical protein
VSKFKDITGQVFGRLTARECVGRGKNRNALWECACECGRNAVVSGVTLRSGNTKSCGCLNRELFAKRSIVHGHAGRGRPDSTYTSWKKMIQRCTNLKVKEFKWYGGANPPVRVCPAWKTFRGFYLDMSHRPAGTTLGRIGDTGDYCKANCEWQTHSADLRTRYAKRALRRRSGT